VKGQRLFLTGSEQTKLLLLAFDTRTGTKQWMYSLPRPRINEIDAQRNDPASPTPSVDSDGVYAFFQDFGLVGVSLQGKELWQLPLGPFKNNYGLGASPVVFGESVFLQCDQTSGSFLIAVNKRTGAIRWRQNRASTIEGWSTPIVVPARGEIVTLSSNGLEAFDVETGQSRWTVPGPDGLMIPTPLLDGDRIIATIRGSEQPTFPSWEETLRALDANGDGKIELNELVKRYHPNSFGIADPDRDGYITEREWNFFRNRGVGEFGITCVRLTDKTIVWRYKRSLPYVPSPVLYQGILYSVRSGGIVLALDARTGELQKEARLPEAGGDYFASPVAADGRIYLASAEGKITVLRAGAKWEVLATNDLAEPIAASPAAAANALFIRTYAKLYSFRQQ
jgi:outer membrane protein assembly factor BamB